MTAAIQAEVAVIGGTGLYSLGLLEGPAGKTLSTPYGDHSDGLAVGKLAGVRAAFLPRHGRGHTLPPHRVPYRANLWALHELGVKRIVAISAMGGLRPEYRIGDLVLPDQFIDWTGGRPATFFDGPQVVHTSLADPFCPVLRPALAAAAEQVGFRVHRRGTCLTFAGPRFSTRAESTLFREVAGADLLSMTLVPEVVLARELGMCYATCAVITDLDVWGPEPVRADQVTEVMRAQLPRLSRLVRLALSGFADLPRCTCAGDAAAPAGGARPTAADPGSQ
ncbi:MAG: S-methyl-5'-thioadenosine phosphorylase [Candidatus Bipolaricaulaceae bacterium]